MQSQARALADPSRFRIFQYIADANEAVGVAELTDLLGFNHNAIRQHLAVLHDAGLVAESDEQRKTRGRPRKQYRLRDDALNAFGSVSGSYKRLSELLLQVAETKAKPFDVGYEAGVKAQEASGEGADVADAERRLFEQLQVDGFEPKSTGNGSTELTNCPFADVAGQNPGIVCELHRGLIQGFVESQNKDFKGVLLPQAPSDAAPCRVTVSDIADQKS